MNPLLSKKIACWIGDDYVDLHHSNGILGGEGVKGRGVRVRVGHTPLKMARLANRFKKGKVLKTFIGMRISNNHWLCTNVSQ